MEQIIAIPFFFLGKRYGDFWELDDKEKGMIARAWKPLLDRYLPLKGETELGTAALVTLAILAPRVMTTDWKAKKKPTAPASTATAGSGESPASSESANPEKVRAWGIFSESHDA